MDNVHHLEKFAMRKQFVTVLNEVMLDSECRVHFSCKEQTVGCGFLRVFDPKLTKIGVSDFQTPMSKLSTALLRVDDIAFIESAAENVKE